MTPDERDRLARLEAYYDHLSTKADNIEEKVDQLLTAANMGKGAWWAMLRFGGLLAGLAAIGAWLVDHWPWSKT